MKAKNLAEFKWLFILFFLSLIAGIGCETMTEKVMSTELLPLQNGTFIYKVIYAGLRHPKLEWEERRLIWLHDFMEQNNFCNQGYKIVKRIPVVKMDEEETGNVIINFYYHIECQD